MKLNDLTGKKFENLTVLYRGEDLVTNGKRRVRWHCKCICGNELDVIYDNLIRRPNMTCNDCANKRRADSNRINVVGNKYGKLIILDVIPNTHPTKVRCKCACGNEYIGTQTDIVSGHTQSCGCLQKERASESNTKNWAGNVSKYGVTFLSQSHINEDGQWMWRCKCGVCGSEFIALPAKINSGHTTSCGCTIKSSAERYIKKLLEELHINFVEQYSFNDCKDTYPLKFDFAVFNSDKLLYLIEYDGEQHFRPVEWFGGIKNFNKQQKRDKIKDNYCAAHNIPLLRLPYTLSNEEIKRQIYEYHLSVTTAGA